MSWIPLHVTKQEESEIKIYRKKLKFLVDENLDNETTDFLCGEGWNAKSSSELGIKGYTDLQLYAYAYKEKKRYLHIMDLKEYIKSAIIPLIREIWRLRCT